MTQQCQIDPWITKDYKRITLDTVYSGLNLVLEANSDQLICISWQFAVDILSAPVPSEVLGLYPGQIYSMWERASLFDSTSFPRGSGFLLDDITNHYNIVQRANYVQVDARLSIQY
jgi:hypothetical protein